MIEPLIQIEPTNYCNLSCIMCGLKYGTNKGFMKKSTFLNAINGLKKMNFKNVPVGLSLEGEPLLHPEFPYFFYETAKMVKKKAIGKIFFFTNGTCLDKSLINFLLTHGKNCVYFINISIDAACEKTYAKIKGANLFNKVLNNIEALFKLKRKNRVLSSEFPVVIQFIAMKENFDEYREFIKLIQSIAGNDIKIDAHGTDKIGKHDLIFFRLLNPIDGKLESEIKAEYLIYQIVKSLNLKNHPWYKLKENDFKKFRRYGYKKKKLRLPCPDIFKLLSIRFNGEITPCGSDTNIKYSYGNVNKQSIEKIWFSKRLQQARIAHITGHFHLVNQCKFCTIKPSMEISDHEIEDFLLNLKYF